MARNFRIKRGGADNDMALILQNQCFYCMIRAFLCCSNKFKLPQQINHPFSGFYILFGYFPISDISILSENSEDRLTVFLDFFLTK